MAIEIVSFPIKHGGSFHSYVELLEGSDYNVDITMPLAPPMTGNLKVTIPTIYGDDWGMVNMTLLCPHSRFSEASIRGELSTKKNPRNMGVHIDFVQYSYIYSGEWRER